MRNDNEKSYERYKQYRLNKYRYEQEQILFPVSIILGLAVLIGLWKYILIGIAMIVVIAIVALFVFVYFKRQIVACQPIVITSEDAREGVEAKIHLTYNSSKVDIDLDIPANVKDGQKFVVRDVLFSDGNGKTVKKRVHFQVRVKD